MMRHRRPGKLAVVTTALAVAAVGLAACSSSSPRSATSGSTSPPARMVKVPGGTMTIAEQPGAGPNYVFPMMSSAYYDVSNLQLVDLMFRPLYWFGVGYRPDLNPGLSVADPPVYSHGARTVTIKMKGYKWSNGETVDAKDVVFWMNMVKADAPSWAAYVPGPDQFPGDVRNVVANDTTDTVVFTLDSAYSEYWFTYNELSQITPLPIAWDVTSAGGAPGSGGCSSATYESITTSMSPTGTFSLTSPSTKACAAVHAFLTGRTEAGDPGTYATNPLWQIVDGPFHLGLYDATDDGATLVPNREYSGPVRPSVDALVLAPFTNDAAEFNVLENGKTINIGYVAPQDLPVYKGKAFGPDGPLVGANNSQLGDIYNLEPQYPWGINYFSLNFTNPTTGPIFKQLYVRQAMQSLMNQTAWIDLFNSGYGSPTYGPVPVVPPTDWATLKESRNPYPYSPSHAKALLTSHGWKVVPNGVTTCVRPGTAAGDCGAGIRRGAQLSFRYLYETDAVSLDAEVNKLASSWAQAGIKLQLEPEAFGEVISTAATPCVAGKVCPWDIDNWGGGWVYSPDFYPTGEEIFASGAGSNFGDYSDAKADALIRATTTSSSLTALRNYENYLALNLPDIWQPETGVVFNEVGKNVCGFVPENPLFTWVAEDWYFCRPAR